MNEMSQIIITEEAARGALAAAIAARTEAKTCVDAAQSKHAEAQARLDEREEALKRAHGAHQEAVDAGAADKDILCTLHKADEAKALADAARVTSEKAAVQLATARRVRDQAEDTVSAATGQVLAAIARKEVYGFRDQWRELIQTAATLYALRTRCVNLGAPVPAEPLDSSIGAAARDGTFPAFYRASRDRITSFIDRLADDPDAQFPPEVSE